MRVDLLPEGVPLGVAPDPLGWRFQVRVCWVLPAIQAVAADAKGDLKVQADGAIRRINDASKPGQYTKSR